MRVLARSTWLAGLLAVISAGALAVATAAAQTQPQNTTKSHPLAGKIFAVGEAQGADAVAPISRDDLVRRIKAADIVLLGEIHDNAEHHRLRAKLLADLKRAAVFEHISIDRQPAIDAALAASGAAPLAPEAFFDAIAWDKSGWSTYPNRDLFETALKLRLPIYAGDVTRALILAAAKEKEAALPEIERLRLKLDEPLDNKSNAALLAEIESSHCGAMPKEAFPGMAFAQRYRDAHLADVALKAAERHGSAVLLAGNGHVRNDRGAPWYIRRRAPDKKLASVTFVEVEDGKIDAAAYLAAGAETAASDFLVFTSAAVRPDPCEAFRQNARQ